MKNTNCTIIIKSISGAQVIYNQHTKMFSIEIEKLARLRIFFLTANIVRIQTHFFDFGSIQTQEQSYAISMTGWKDRFDQLLKDYRVRIDPIQKQSLHFSEKQNFYYFKTANIIVKLYKQPFGFEICDRNQNVLHSDLKGKAMMRDHKGRVYHYVEHDQTQDCFYGFGQQTGKLNKYHLRIYQAPKDALGYDADSTSSLYKHIPFYIRLNKQTKQAVGYFYDNTYESYFDMGNQRSGYWPKYSYFCADGGDIDLYFIYGPQIRQIVQRYTDLTGKTAFSPMQSLGYIGSTMYYAQLSEKCDEAILNFVKMCKKYDIPVSNFHLSSGYTMDKKYKKRLIFSWNSSKFPNPEQFFSDMHNQGVSVSPNLKPGLLKCHPLYEQFNIEQAFIKTSNKQQPYVDQWWGGAGSFLDFTSPKGRQLWKKHLQKQLICKGTFTIWNDNNQYEQISNKQAYCDFDGKGSTVSRLKPIQSLLMSHLTVDALAEIDPNKRPYIISRSGYAGIQRYASSWSGDNYSSWTTLKHNIATVLNMGLSGVANYGCDIGGFWGPAPTQQLFVRWVQHGIFQPRFSIHSCNSDNTVTEPWMYEESTYLISSAIKFRYEMMPYLYSLLYNSYKTGQPIMRPLIYEFQNDISCYNEGQTFMLGPYILVANVLEPLQLSNFKKIYLPNGSDWLDFNSSPYKKYSGGTNISIPVDIKSIPMFIRSQAIIPFTKNYTDINRQQINNINLLVACQLSGNKKVQNPIQFVLYEDDGKTNDYKDQIYLKTCIKVERKDEKIVIGFNKTGKWLTKVQTWQIQIILLQICPFSITLLTDNNEDDIQIKQFLHKQLWDKQDYGFYYNNTKKSVLLKMPNCSYKHYRIQISLNKLICFKKQYNQIKE